jgi:transcriptional regulator with XRE-family HTH domain
MNDQPEKRKRRKRDPEESQTVGLAILRLRREAGMTVRQLSAASDSTVAALTRYEQGHSLPRVETLRRIVAAMGGTMMDLYRAQQSAGESTGKVEDGTLPPDTRTPPTTAHKAAVRLAQECGKGVAHCCLAFLELQAGGWHDTEGDATTRKGNHP